MALKRLLSYYPPTHMPLRGYIGVIGLLGGLCLGEMLCLKLRPHFSSHLNKTCYTWLLGSVDVHTVFSMRHGIGVQELCPFFKFLNVFILRMFFSQTTTTVYKSSKWIYTCCLTLVTSCKKAIIYPGFHFYIYATIVIIYVHWQTHLIIRSEVEWEYISNSLH